MNVSPTPFRSYDIRGIAGRELTEEFARALGGAFLKWLRDRGNTARTVVVGKDMRPSSAELERALVATLVGCGVQVRTIGMVASEQFYFACAKAQSPGITVTASHNPAAYTGFKLVENIPYLIGGTELQELRKLMEQDKFAPTVVGQGREERWDIRADFASYLRQFVHPGRWKRQLKIVIDAGNGMGGTMAEEVLRELPVSVTCLFCEPDGRFPNHVPDPMKAENRRWIEEAVKAQGADVGLAFDGDADRMLAIDETGRVIPGDFLTALLGEYFCGREPGSKVIYDARASWAVRDRVATVGGLPIMWRVGHTHIKRKMAEEAAIFGGEVSGHFYYRDFFHCDSGMLTALLVLDLLASGQQKLSDIASPLRSKYFLSGELNFEVKDPPTVIATVKQHFARALKVYELDGLSVEEADWHFNLRPSNTEPLLRLNVEALSKALLEEKEAMLRALIQQNSRP